MSFDFTRKPIIFNEEDIFIKLCESIEDAIREADDGEGKYSDLEVMQAIDFVGFNLFRDDWDEFKKIESSRDLSLNESNKLINKKIIN